MGNSMEPKEPFTVEEHMALIHILLFMFLVVWSALTGVAVWANMVVHPVSALLWVLSPFIIMVFALVAIMAVVDHDRTALNNGGE